MSCTIIYKGVKYTEEEFKNLLFPVKSKPTKQGLRDRISEIVNGNSYLLQYFGDNDLASKRPTQEEIEEYEELLKNKERSPRFKELRDKFNQWQIIDGTVDGEQDSTLGDYINLYLKVEEQESAPKEEQLDQLSETDYSKLDEADESTERGGFEPYGTISSPDVVLANVLNDDNTVEFSYISIEKFADLFPEHEVYLLEDMMEKPFQPSKEEGTVYLFKGKADNDFLVRVNRKSRLAMDGGAFNKNAKNIVIKSSGVSAFRTVYVLNDNGTYSPLETDFELDGYNRTATNALKQGDELVLEVDPNDPYNKKILRDKKLTDDEKANSLNIIMKKDGVVVGNFTAIPNGERVKQTKELEKNKSIRERALKAVQDSELPVTMPFKVEVEMTLMGNPRTELDGDKQTVERPITMDAMDAIVSVGYMKDREAEGTHPKDTVWVYANVASEKNSGKRVPFVVIRYAGKNIAFPISLDAEYLDLSGSLTDILSSNLSPAQKASKILDLKAKTEIDFTNPMWEESEQINQLYEELKNVKTTKIQNLTDKQQLVNNATIGVDILNHPFFSNKVLLNLPDVFETSDLDIIENNITSTVDTIFEIAKEVEKDYRTNNEKWTDKKDNRIESDELDELSDKLATEDQGSFLVKQSVIKTLTKLIENNSKKASVRDRIGKDTFNKLKTLVNAYNKQETTRTKNKQLEKEIKEKDCK